MPFPLHLTRLILHLRSPTKVRKPTFPGLVRAGLYPTWEEADSILKLLLPTSM